ncbi:MAG: twin-arginine translocation signal domain-containing protein, partial [Bradymonadaceae bacterium]
MNDDPKKPTSAVHRRTFLKGIGVAAASVAMPHVWVPNKALASTHARGEVKHLVYVRLSGGFRFPAAFNADVGAEFNPFGQASNVAPGTEWGVGELLEQERVLMQALSTLYTHPLPDEIEPVKEECLKGCRALIRELY